MKKKALRKDFYMEISKSLGRFLSIFFIVALGVAFFSGIRASEPDMRISGDSYFDRQNLMDIKVVSTLGVTKNDLKAIGDIEGVETVEGGYSTDAICEVKESQKVLHVVSQLKTMNQVAVTKGRLPEKPGECLVDSNFLESTSLKIGDTITLQSGKDTDIKDTLNNNKLKIVGKGDSPSYISFGRGSSNIGTGDVSGFLLVSEKEFKSGPYTEIYSTVEGAKATTAFTPDYEKKVEKIQTKIEDIADAQCEARRKEIVDDATVELIDAQKKYDEGKAEADTKLSEVAATLADGETQLADAKAQTVSGRSAIKEAKATLQEKQKQLDAGRLEYQAGKKQLEDAKAEIASKEAQYQEKAAEAEAQFAKGEAMLTQARADLDKGWSEYHANEEQLKLVQANLAGATQQLEAMKQDPNTPLEEIEAMEQTIAGLTDTEALLSAGLAQAKGSLDAGEAQYAPQKQAFEEQKGIAEAQLLEGRKALDAGSQEIAANEKKLEAAFSTIQSGQMQIDDGWATVKENEDTLTAGEAEIADNEKVLIDGKAEYEANKQKVERELAENANKLADANQKIKDMEHPKWYVDNRDVLPEYSGYGDNADRMRAIGEVFPVLFFLVAALISLTTMTRMVEEQRVQIGTLKALGYSKFSIAGKYLGYAFLATLGGSIFGVLVGEKILPYIIVSAYKIMYQHIPDVKIPYNLEYALMASLAAIACTMAATIFACYSELAAQPSVLMRPPSPKQGKRVLIERITILWKHLSFTWKSTIRNLFRYKKRFLMTVFGIGGCMALMLVGFGIKDSISNIATLQYQELQSYEGTAYLKDEITHEQRIELRKVMDADTNIEDYAETFVKKISVGKGEEEQELYLIVPEETDKIGRFVKFRDRISKKVSKLEDSGVILTEKVAKELKVKKGQTIYIKIGNSKETVKVSDITENYMGHFIYVSPTLYKNIYGEEPNYNSVLFKIKETTDKALKKTGERLLTHEGVLNVSYTNNMEDRLNDMLKTLNLVIIVLIIAAGMLAFVVLYNLINININERKRELATIKVLGFYDMEVGRYVYRENVLLTAIGTMAGVVMGTILHQFVIVTVEIDEVMFGRNVNFSSFIYSIVLTIAFAAFVNWVMYYKLKRIDMVESLKSIE